MKGEKISRFNTELLKNNDKLKQFQERLTASLPTEEDISASERWERCKSALLTTGSEVIGPYKRQKQNDWFDEECERVTTQKNITYKKMIQRRTRANVAEYKNARKREKRTHRTKKREHENRQIESLENLRETNETKSFYKELNEQRKGFKPRTILCKDNEGNLLTDPNLILSRWVQHFDQLLNANANVDINGENLRDGNEEEQEAPTIVEIQEALKKFKNNKSPGSDQIPAEFLKQGGAQLTGQLHKIYEQIWTTEEMPEEWNMGIICPIHKKGDPLNCKNYRGITLLNVAYKLLSNILYGRLLPYTEKLLGEYQCGFRPGKSTTDQIFILRQILEKGLEFNIDTVHMFIDFKSAYDSIIRVKLYEALYSLEIPRKLIDLVMMTMKNVRCRIKIQNNISESLEVRNGLRQGDALACLLFNICLEKAVRDANINTRGTIITKSIQLLAYADDIDIVARTLPEMTRAYTELAGAANSYGLQINEEKTKIMPVTTSPRVIHNLGQNFTIGTENFEVVQEFTYLGSSVNTKNDSNAEIGRRILLGNKCYNALRKQLSNRNISRKTKLIIYKTLILPVVTYGAETWAISKRDADLLRIFERRVLRTIFKGTCENGIWRRRYNFELYQLLRKHEEPDIITRIKTSRLQWAGHVERAQDTYVPKRVMNGKLQGRRKQGRPKLRWEDGVLEDATKIGFGNWRTAARNKDEWRRKLWEARTRTGL